MHTHTKDKIYVDLNPAQVYIQSCYLGFLHSIFDVLILLETKREKCGMTGTR